MVFVLVHIVVKLYYNHHATIVLGIINIIIVCNVQMCTWEDLNGILGKKTSDISCVNIWRDDTVAAVVREIRDTRMKKVEKR